MKCVPVVAGLFGLLSLSAGRVADAQDVDSLVPRAGAWGAEAAVLSTAGSLLRFTSPRRAWLAGLSFGVWHQDQSVGVAASNFSVRGQLGTRWYHATMGDRHLHNTVGLGLTGDLTGVDFPDQSARQWDIGPYGELGETWFFTPHLSLGAIGLLQATVGRQNHTNSGAPDQTTKVWSVSGSLIRILAGVYF
ncbi:MAG TPA: hypothetical protein VF159_04820 [Gemmatimonadaceae bacterium]